MNRNTIIAIVIGVVVLLVAAYMLFLKPKPEEALTASAPTSVAEATFLNLAQQLEPLGFDTSILDEPRFKSLVDIHTAVLPEPSSRRDPFAPLGK